MGCDVGRWIESANWRTVWSYIQPVRIDTQEKIESNSARDSTSRVQPEAERFSGFFVSG